MRAFASLLVGSVLMSGVAVCCAQTVGLPDAPSALLDGAQKAADAVVLGTISGTVVDVSGAEVGGASVVLMTGASKEPRKTVASDDGTFRFADVPPGKYSIRAESAGMMMVAKAGVLAPGERLQFPELTLAVSGVSSEVDALTVHDQAEMELHVEEHQRLIGVIPNYYVVYNWDAAPLSSKQKYKLAYKNVVDPFNAGISAGVAGIQYAANDFKGYGRGPSGYFKRFGANEGDLTVGTFVGGAILPSLLKQDPRYFYMGKGTILHRTLYALATAVITKGDNGKWQPNYSSMGGDIASGAVAQLYYPSSDRDGGATIVEDGVIAALLDGLGNVAQEFLFKRVTPHAPKYSSTEADTK